MHEINSISAYNEKHRTQNRVLRTPLKRAACMLVHSCRAVVVGCN